MGPQGMKNPILGSNRADNTDLIQSGTNKRTNSDFITKQLSTGPINSLDRPAISLGRRFFLYLLKAVRFFCAVFPS